MQEKGCKYCEYWYRDYDAPNCPRKYEDQSDQTISTVLLTLIVVALLHSICYDF